MANLGPTFKRGITKVLDNVKSINNDFGIWEKSASLVGYIHCDKLHFLANFQWVFRIVV